MSQPHKHSRVPFWLATADLLAAGARRLRQGGTELALFYILSQAVVTLIALPILGLLVREALAAAGLAGIDAPQLALVFDTPVSLGLFALVAVLGYFLTLAQLLLILIAVLRVRAGTSLHPRDIVAEFGRLVRKLARPSAIGLAPYALVLLPLSGFGFFSALTRTIAVPEFISGELTKTVPGIIGYTLFLLVLGYLSVRFALTLPFFVTSEATGGKAGRLSWRATSRLQVPLFFSVGTVAVAATVAGAVILVAAIAPTILTDAVAPAASPITASVGLAVAVALGILVMGVAIVMIAAILLRCTEIAEHGHRGLSVHSQDPAQAIEKPRPRRRYTAVAATVLVILAVGTGALTAPIIFEVSKQPDTLVLTHRGFNGVENTIGGLEGANRAGSDLIEIDVMQTADNEFVVLHDSQLTRLAALDMHVADLTLAEATAITVRDLNGHEGLIPSLADYLSRADELDQQILVEVKLHGRETEEFLEDLVKQMEEQGVLNDHIYHSLDVASVDGLKRLRPGLTVGYTMAFAGTALPKTQADFVVIEEWSYSSDMNNEAKDAGLGMFVWTVNDEMKIRQMLRDDVDGIITDHPDIALLAREQMHNDDGLAPVLFDTIMRFVTIF